MKKTPSLVLNLPGITANKRYTFDYVLDDAFFAERDQSIVQGGLVNVQLDVDRTDRLLTLTFHLQGSLRLTCDRSLDEFDSPLDLTEKLHVRFGEEVKELDDDVLQITPDTQVLPLASHLFDYIATSVPMKRLHPRYAQADAEADAAAGEEANLTETRLIYTASTDQDDAPADDNEPPNDPRWNALRNLN